MGFLKVALLFSILLAGVNAKSAELRWALRTDPKTFDPLLAAEEASEAVRYLTGGVLLRFNRGTHQLEAELAQSWKVSPDRRRIDFILRDGVIFSDGTAFGPRDVVATVRRMTDPSLRSAVADTFRPSGASIRAEIIGQSGVSVTLSAPIAGVEYLFDQLAITSANAVPDGRVSLGPFTVAEHRSGQYVLLRRNPNYWKKDARGLRLPYVDSVRLDIQANREAELMRFRRGELHFVNKLEPDVFQRLRKDMPRAAVDAGASLDIEFLWFNQVSNAPISSHKRAWFQSTRFRSAVSSAVQRADIVRLVYLGYASPAVGPISIANKVWFNAKVKAPAHDTKQILGLLSEDGFRLHGSVLKDNAGNPVEFSLITNAGSKTRTQLGSIIQQDLSRIGIRINLIPLEFQSLIERITKTNNYEACLLGLTNVEADPNSQMNIWTSSGTHHAWNPMQKTAATSWEAEIDLRMREQANASDFSARKKAFDRVQEIVAAQAPIIYLVHPNVLVAVSPSVRNASVSALPPHFYWNVESLSLAGGAQEGR